MTHDALQERSAGYDELGDYRLLWTIAAGVTGVLAAFSWVFIGVRLSDDGPAGPHTVSIWVPILAVVATAACMVATVLTQLTYMASRGWFTRNG
ncbi:MAG: hypothetical protein QOK14_611 [Frankiaceae bacterium]|nr:hypothetical protein [Frankiaceae bacterium]